MASNVYKMFPKIGMLLALIAVAFATAPYSADIYEFDTKQQDVNLQFKIDENYRLPKSVVPEKYIINYDLVSDKEFKGNVVIEAKVVKNYTYVVKLHRGPKMIIQKPVINLINTIEDIVSDTFYNETREIQSVWLSKTLNIDDRISIRIKFSGPLRDDMTGFYKSTYIDETKTEKWLAATQFEATSARHAFPCFDEPAFKARFTVIISKKGWPVGYDCLSNMPRSKNNIKNVCEFEESVPMSTYLVAFIVSDFKAKKDKTTPPDVKVWTRNELLEQATYAGKIASAAIKFGEKFGIPYSLTKMDLVAVPDFAAGAMENWGLLTFREANLLHDEANTANVYKQRIASVVVHEVAHMWFGNLVTPKWWSYLWLSEAFARYYQYMGTAEIEKEWRMEEQFVIEQHQSALGVDALEDSKPMTREVASQSEIGGMGDSITYNKGASILRMIEQTFGSLVFNTALRDYMEQMQYKNASPDDLWRALQARIDLYYGKKIDITEYMKSWTEKPGFPYIKATIKSDNIELKQERFLLRNQNNTNTKDTVWFVPISVMSSSKNRASTEPVYWLTANEGSFKYENASTEDWLILNVHSTGFYRVHYDDESWKKIIKILNSDQYEKIPVLNRAAILDDLFNLARAELIGYDFAFNALQYLKRETDYLPFKTAFTALDHLIKKFSASSSYDLFKDHIFAITSNIYQRLLKDDESKDDHTKALLRQEIYNRACSLDHPECIKRAVNLFDEWMKDENKSVPKNQRSAVYCAAIKNGNSKHWDFLWRKYKSSKLATEQLTILSALGCQNQFEIIEKYLLRALNPKYTESLIRKQDISSVFSAVYSPSPKNAEHMLDFINTNYEAIKTYYNNLDEIGTIVSGILQKYPTKRLITKVEKMMNENSNFKTVLSSLEKSVKLAKWEMNKFNQYSTVINDYIKKSDENTIAYRLPENVIPESYAIHLTPIFENKFTFDGKVDIQANVAKSTKEIVLHSDQINIEKITVTAEGQAIENSFYSNLKYNFTIIELSTEVKEKTKIRISITYTGYLNTEMRGFYRSSYDDKGQKRWLAATHLEPVGARRVFPCFDEPALKATFDITVTAPKGYHVISNTLGTKIAEPNVWKFETTPKMSTYLVAIVVSDFVSKSTTNNDLTYTVWSSKLVSHQLNYSLSVMNPVVRDFEDRLEMKYPVLKKLEMVALPDFSSGAMENWGLITYRESNMLYESWMTPLPTKQAIRNVIAHEIAHQWFGNLVSPLWWDYLWLNEGFARYFQYFAHTKDEDSWNLEAQFVVDQLQTSFSTDASSSTHPITHEVYSPTEIRGLFDTISYAKAGSVIRMMEKWIGSERFYKSLTEYLRENSLSTGEPDKLFKAFKKNGLAPEYFRNWTLQSGFPMINVFINSNTVTITQKRFYLKPKSENVKNASQKWIIPITYATGDHPDFSKTIPANIWDKEDTYKLTIKNADKTWVIFNLQQSGYYRVKYDNAAWARIFDVLDSDNYLLVHEINRAMIVDDLLNLARAGEITYDLTFKGLRYLRRETEYTPWKAAFNGFSYLKQRLTGRGATYVAYRNYLLELLEPAFQRLGFDDKDNDKHTDILLRKLVLEWMCSLSEDKCINKARQLLQEEIKSGHRVTANQQPFVYCNAIKHGGTNESSHLKKKLKDSIYSTEKLTILAALGCSQDLRELTLLLEDAVKPESDIRLQDAQKVFTNVIDSGLLGVKAVLEFIEARHEDMKKRFDGNSVTKSLINTISKRLSTPELNEKFEKFINDAIKKIPELEKTLQKYLKSAKYELNWYTENSAKILQQLDTHIDAPYQSSYRLPTVIEPISYNIYLTPYLDEPEPSTKFKFDGKVVIKIKAKQNTPRITLNSDKLEFNMKNIQLSNNNEIAVEPICNSTTQQCTIYLKSELKENTEVDLTIEYKGILRNDMRGFYKSSYIDKDGTTKWIASTHFEPTYARSAFPCFDEPSLKAKFTVNIAPPKGYGTLSNMGSNPTKKPHETIKDREWHVYKESEIMSSYLVAFVVSDFKSVKHSDDSRVAVWSRKELNDYCVHASELGHKALENLEKLLDYEYVLREMNFVSVPDFDMGAMENWGLVTFREYGLSYDLEKISATYRRYVNTVISHELVHMWFGNLVTLEWWDYTWLNEGFAEYISYIISDMSEPSWQLLKQFVTNEMHVALDADAAESSHPMNNKVLKPTDIQDAFDKIAYQKSASVLRMFNNAFGFEAFFKSLRSYIETNAFKNTHPRQLIAEFQKKIPGNIGDSEVDVTTIMNSWTTQAGYPVVTATRSDNVIKFKQERFLVSSKNQTAKNVAYWTPITLTAQPEYDFNDVKPKHWLNKGEISHTVDIGDDMWYIVNVQQVGYYRVNYDEKNWLALIKQLNSEQYSVIHELNRAQLIDDSLNLARADYISYDVALNITKYLSQETNYFSWKAFFNSAAYLSQRIEGQPEIQKLYQKYVLSRLSTAFNKLTFKEVENDNHLDQLARELILTYTCKYGNEDCIQSSKAYFSEENINPNIAGAVYCTAIENGNSEDWDELWNRYEKALLASDYITMLKGLGCSKDTKIIEQYLKLAFESNLIRRQDLATVLSSVYTSSQIGLETAIKYFLNNLEKLHNYYGNWDDVGSLFTSLAGRISKQSQIDDLKKSVNDSGDVQNVKSYLESAIKTAEKNLEWFNEHSGAIKKWLENYHKIEEDNDNDAAATVTIQICMTLISLFTYFSFY